MKKAIKVLSMFIIMVCLNFQSEVQNPLINNIFTDFSMGEICCFTIRMDPTIFTGKFVWKSLNTPVKD